MDSKDQSSINAKRKSEHLRIVLKEDVEHRRGTFLDDVHLIHQALPELDLEDIDLSTEFFGRKLKAPLMITSMTGGAEFSEKINTELALVANNYGIAFSVGSQRIVLDRPELSNHFNVRKYIPDSVLLSNIGAVQLSEYTPEMIASLAENIEADGICVHLNPAQEMIQYDGQTNFRGQLEGIARLVEIMDGRVLVKETGAGLSPQALRKLVSIGIKYVDVSGAGGTSWTKVEAHRANSVQLKRAGKTFADWGIPTAVSLYAAKKILPDDAVIIASGGIKTGLDSARAIALGAGISGFARSILKKFMKDDIEGAGSYLDTHIYELKTAMLLCGAANVKELRSVPKIITGNLKEWISELHTEPGDSE